MKKLAIIALSVLAASCNKYKVSGEVKGMPDGTIVYLEKQNESAATGITGVDTTTVKDGKFEFKGKAEEPLMHRVRFDQLGGFMFVLENGDINVKAVKDSLMMGIATVTGSRTNDEIIAYKKSLNPIKNKAQVLKVKYENAEKDNDTVQMKKIDEEFKKIAEEFPKFGEQYIEKNTDSFVSILIIQDLLANPQTDVAKVKKSFDNLSNSLKETTTGKKLKKHFEMFEKANQEAPKKKLS